MKFKIAFGVAAILAVAHLYLFAFHHYIGTTVSECERRGTMFGRDVYHCSDSSGRYGRKGESVVMMVSPEKKKEGK